MWWLYQEGVSLNLVELEGQIISSNFSPEVKTELLTQVAVEVAEYHAKLELISNWMSANWQDKPDPDTFLSRVMVVPTFRPWLLGDFIGQDTRELRQLFQSPQVNYGEVYDRVRYNLVQAGILEKSTFDPLIADWEAEAALVSSKFTEYDWLGLESMTTDEDDDEEAVDTDELVTSFVGYLVESVYPLVSEGLRSKTPLLEGVYQAIIRQTNLPDKAISWEQMTREQSLTVMKTLLISAFRQYTESRKLGFEIMMFYFIDVAINTQLRRTLDRGNEESV